MGEGDLTKRAILKETWKFFNNKCKLCVHVFIFWGVTGDFEPGLAPYFALVFRVPYWGCVSHFAGNVRKNGDKTHYKVDIYQKEWEKSLRTVPCLPPSEIPGKVTKFTLSSLKKQFLEILFAAVAGQKIKSDKYHCYIFVG